MTDRISLDDALALESEARRLLADYREAHDELPEEDILVTPQWDPLRIPADAVAATIDLMISALPKIGEDEDGQAEAKAEPTWRTSTERPSAVPEIHLGSDGATPVYYFRPGFNASYIIAHATNHADLRARIAGVVSMLRLAKEGA